MHEIPPIITERVDDMPFLLEQRQQRGLPALFDAHFPTHCNWQGPQPGLGEHDLAQRDEEAALRFLKKAIRRHGVPEKIMIDGSAANEATIKNYNKDHGTSTAIRQIKYLNNIVGQDHRAVKRVTRPMLGFKSFDAVQGTLAGIELMHMIKKRQMIVETGDEGFTAAELFYSFAA